MLYNKNWEKTHIKADPFSLENLIAWLEKQPAQKEYDYLNCEGYCLIGQYLTAHGKHWSRDYDLLGDSCLRVDVAGTAPYTFGAALNRAREALAER